MGTSFTLFCLLTPQIVLHFFRATLSCGLYLSFCREVCSINASRLGDWCIDMAYTSFQDFCEAARLVTPGGFSAVRGRWKAAMAGGGTETLTEFLLRENEQSEDVYLDRVAEAFDWQRIDLSDVRPTNESLRRIPSKVANQHVVMPVKVEEGVLEVAVSSPFETGLLGAVRFAAQGPVRFLLAPREEIGRAYEKFYGVGAETIDELAQNEVNEEEDFELLMGDGKEIAGDDQEASIIKFVNQVIWQAHKSRATDIHFEPQEDELVIRHRIDGILHAMPLPPQLKQLQASLISRIKVMAGMNIAEKRLPQDGRIGVRVKGEDIDIRVSTVPTVYGESVSLRLLMRGSILKGLDTLGMKPITEKAVKEVIVKPHGIMLVTGPTGSGKSTSLYAFLNTINSIDKRIMTVEDPVEYELKGINQVSVKNDIGRSFANVLRHFLRQDPDVIMVGEIRDGETADIAIQAANTGHLVFSTLHTNDAPSAYTRLIDMGSEPFLVADAIEAVMAQRLIRTICPGCKAPHDYPREDLVKIGFPVAKLEGAGIWKGEGCEQCGERGYTGRTGIYELLVSTEAVEKLVIDSASASVIGQQARADGMQTLRDDGWIKVLAGQTSLEEVLRVTQMVDLHEEEVSA